MQCSFCGDSSLEERILEKNILAYAVLTKTPIVPGHVLILPVRCVSRLEDATNDELRAILSLRLRLKSALIKTFDAEGFNYAWNEGEHAGQSTPHFHLHIVPRKKGDSGIYQYEPRQFLYRPGTREISPDEELKAVAQLIKSNL